MRRTQIYALFYALAHRSMHNSSGFYNEAPNCQPSVISKSNKTTDSWELAADGLIEKVTYTWFNRFCALRFIDMNRYVRIGVVSPAEGQSQPEILAEAKISEGKQIQI